MTDSKQIDAQDEIKQIVTPLACVLSQLVARTDQIPVHAHQVTKFHALSAPGISIKDYLTRMAKYAGCSTECFVFALVYLDRIAKRHPNFIVNSLNVHRLLITSVMLAAKSWDDQYYNNAYYAKVGGVPTSELNGLEVEMLKLLNFRTHVRASSFEQYRNELLNHGSSPAVGCDCAPPQHVSASLTPVKTFNSQAYASKEAVASDSGSQGQFHSAIFQVASA
eukprot:GILI01001759.1.p1 GENE.GILI01001759.1~~GILI01001759.1.p1  ORF type:complete len:222 (-),score=39.15 GILI01001759.1:177-842(-)